MYILNKNFISLCFSHLHSGIINQVFHCWIRNEGVIVVNCISLLYYGKFSTLWVWRNMNEIRDTFRQISRWNNSSPIFIYSNRRGIQSDHVEIIIFWIIGFSDSEMKNLIWFIVDAQISRNYRAHQNVTIKKLRCWDKDKDYLYNEEISS